MQVFSWASSVIKEQWMIGIKKHWKRWQNQKEKCITRISQLELKHGSGPLIGKKARDVKLPYYHQLEECIRGTHNHSCTTNCLNPLAQVINDRFGIIEVFANGELYISTYLL